LCHRIYRSDEYSALIPAHGNYAFDLIVEIGLARFSRHQQNREIQQELNERWGLLLPCSTISELAQCFLDYLAATHQAHIPELREFLHNDRGYALHVDGTCEAGTEIVFNAVAGNRGWTLAGCKMATEDITQIGGLLRRCVEWFGQPLALVRDLSAQIDAAHQQIMPEVPDLICHYHFLQNVGTKLCEKHHTKLIACLRRLKLRPALCSLRRDVVRYAKQNGSLTPAQIEQLLTEPEEAIDLDPAQKRRALAYLLLRWLEDYGADLQGEYFPFDLPGLAFYRRCRTTHDWLVKELTARQLPKMFCTLETILRHLDAVAEDKETVATAERLEKAATLFNELRNVLRLCSDGHHPLLHQRPVPDGPISAMQREEHLQKRIDQLNHRLTLECDDDRAFDLTIVLDYLHKYHGKITGHVIVLNDRPDPFVVQRTNNISEHHFGRTKQGLRRKLGTKNLARYVQAMRPEEFLVDNLRDPVYLQILCGGTLENLASSFAQNYQEGQMIRSQRKAKTNVYPIPVGRQRFRDPGFLPQLQRAVATAVQNITERRAVA
jgi:hypothetical protein